MSIESFADLPASGLVWMFCAAGSRKLGLGCLPARKQQQSSEGRAWALWVTQTLGASGGSSAPLCLCPPAPTPGLSPGGAVGYRKPPQHQRNLHRAARGDLERQSQHSLSASQVPAPLDKPHPHPTRPMWAHLTALPGQAPLAIENLGLDSSHATQPPHLAQGRVDWVRGPCPRAFTLEA